MKKTKRIFALAIVLALAAVLLSACGGEKTDGTTAPTTTTAPPAPMSVTVAVKDCASEYVIVSPYKSEFLGASLSGISSSIRRYATATLGATGINVKNDMAEPIAKEVLVGDTNRPETATIAARLAETKSDACFQYVIAELNGKIVIYGETTEAYTFILDYFMEAYCTDTEISVPADCFDVQTMTWVAYNEYLAEVEEEEKRKEEEAAMAYYNKLRENLRNLPDVSKFGGVPTLTVPDEWSALDFAYPQAGAHPRVLVNRTTLATLKENLTAEENAYAMKNYRDYYAAFKKYNFGVLGEITSSSAKKYNHDENILNAIEACAFKY